MTNEERDYYRKLALAIHKRFQEKGEPESAQDAIYLLHNIGDEWAHKRRVDEVEQEKGSQRRT